MKIKNLVLILGLSIFTINLNAQTLQEVTDNGNNTTNKIGINNTAPVYYYDHRITNGLSGIEKAFRISTYGGTNFSRRFNIEVLGNGANANDFYQFYGGELHPNSTIGSPVFATYGNWSGFVWEWRGSSSDDLTLYGIESSVTGAPATIQNTLLNFNAVSGNIGIGTSDQFGGLNNLGLQIDRAGHSSLLIGDGINDGGIIQSSDNRQRIFIGSNLYDDPTTSWQNFTSGYSSAVDLIGDLGLIRFLTSSSDNGYNASNIRMSILPNGYVGIGTTDPKSKLAVNGQIRATEVKVLADISVPDYVFESDYELRTLQETKEYITENKHLPEIPSAAEIGENGIDLGNMNMMLLKKIEELTLYQIELMEEMEKMKMELKALKN